MQCALQFPRETVILIIALAGMANSASAQETSAGKGPAPVYGLDLKAHASVSSGKVAGSAGTVDRAGHRLHLEHLDLMQPMVVQFMAERYRRPDRSPDMQSTPHSQEHACVDETRACGARC